MSCNVGNTYIDFSKKNITKYMKLMLNNKFDKEIFSELLKTYIDVRYCNYYDIKYKNFEANINYYMREKANSLINKNEDKINVIKYTFHLFKYILYFDDVNSIDTNFDDIINELLAYRKNELNFNNDNFECELSNLTKEILKKKKNFFENFETSRFQLLLTKTNNKNIFYSSIDYDIKFPKIYSSYSKNKVFNSGVVNENKYFIEYYLLCNVILDDIISGNFNKKYITNFCLSLFNKEEKCNSLLNVINNDSIKDKFIITFLYADYLKYKDKINNLISLGYRIAITIDDNFELNETNIKKLDIFSYIVVKDTMYENSFDRSKMVIVDR